MSDYLDSKSALRMQVPCGVSQRNRMSAGNVLARTLEPPLAAPHPQRLAADAEHPCKFGLAVGILKALDDFADIFLDRQGSRAAGKRRHGGAHHRQRGRNLCEV